MPGFLLLRPRSVGVAFDGKRPENNEAAVMMREGSKRFLCGVLVSAAFLALPCLAAAQDPGRTITIVVPFTPGTGPDILARTIGEEIQRRWNQPVVVDNKPGASGNIGTQVVARAAPDGLTLLMTSNPFTANISLLKDVAYDPVKSFAPIVAPGYGVLALAV